jgi:hypothetical protein
VAFKSYSEFNSIYNYDRNSIAAFPEIISVKLHTKSQLNLLNWNWNKNGEVKFVNLLENLNVSDCVSSDATVCIGYLER